MPAKKISPPKPVSPRDGDLLVLVGTMKGLFLLRSDRGRRKFQMSGPHFPGSSVYAAAFDSRNGRHRIWSAPSSMHWGAELCFSDDFGKTWNQPETPRVRFPEGSGATLKNIWQISPGRAEDADVIFCGVEPSALFESRDAGETWRLNDGLWNHPHRAKWMPGGGGLSLHTVLVDPKRPGRMVVATSTGGAYRTDDGGRNWHVKNRGVRAEFMPDPYPEFGQCVHKIARHPSMPDRFYMQNHGGLYRSDDAAESWHDVAHGVPNDFGFALVVHPHDPDTAFIAPLNQEMRAGPGGKLRIYKTTNGAKSWKPLTKGLAQKDAYETILRDGMACDAGEPAGLYFGTRSGKVFASRNEGTTFAVIADALPAVTCVKTGALA